VHVLSIAFYPAAFQALGGPSPAAIRNRATSADAVVTAHLAGLFADCLNRGCADVAFELLQNALSPLWDVARVSTFPQSYPIHQWTRDLVNRAATAGTVRGVRQTERRFKGWTGQSYRDLSALGRSERLFREVMRRKSEDGAAWASLAAEFGYSDQSHLIRHTKKFTGFSPVELVQRVRSDPSFWFYRLLAGIWANKH
jgi:hypothetical protein